MADATQPTQSYPACAPCAELPSSNSAYRLVKGDVKAIPYVVRDWGVRSLMGAFGAGVAQAVRGREIDPVEALVAGAAMSTVIEGFVIGYQAVTVWQEKRNAAALANTAAPAAGVSLSSRRAAAGR